MYEEHVDGIDTALQTTKGPIQSHSLRNQYLIGTGHIDFRTEDVDLCQPSEELVDRHDNPGCMSTSESRGHLELKLQAVEYLQRNGFEIPKTQPPFEPADSDLWYYDCFEKRAGYGDADVKIESGDETVVVEVGHTPHDRLWSAFGYLIEDHHPDRDNDLDDRLNRIHDHGIDQFISIPYTGHPDSEKRLYIFEPGDKIPEPNFSTVSENVTEVFGDER